MKLLKIIVSIIVGRIIHAGIKHVFPLTTNDPDTAFLIGGVLGGGSILVGFAIVFGLSGYLQKRKVPASAKEPPKP